jgi:hypothetical protein
MTNTYFLVALLFFVCLGLNAQDALGKTVDKTDNADVPKKDWSDHEANVFGKTSNSFKDTTSFELNFKNRLSELSDYLKANPNVFGNRMVEMPNTKPAGHYSMPVYPIDSTAKYALKVFKY